jgi:AP-4 complex subunit sigma-1
MTIKFMLLVNKQGQTRMAKYFTEHLSTEERRALEGEVVRKCLSRTDKQVALQTGLPSCASWIAASETMEKPLLVVHGHAMQCSFFELRQYRIVYRRYASLFFMVGVDEEEVGLQALMG